VSLVLIMKKTAALLLLLAPLIVLSSCQTGRKVTVSPQEMAEFSVRIRRADELYATGTYNNLKAALEAYQDLSSFPAFPLKTNEKLLKTALLLSLRAKELAILETSYVEIADRLIRAFPPLKIYKPYLEASKAISNSPQGANMSDVSGDSDLGKYFDWVVDNIASLHAEFQKKAFTSPLHAYFFISLHEVFENWIKEKADFSHIKAAFAHSPLIRYKLALYPELDPDSLTSLRAAYPDFLECAYALGTHSLRFGKTLTAEKFFLEAFHVFPESTALIMALTKVSFALEEFEKCLELNSRVLQAAPRYRDALMGKAVCLSFLNRHEEALEVCSTLLELGSYYMGEAHYWKAWNLKDLNRLDEAWVNIETAKKYLIGHHEVFFLSGVIAFNQKNLQVAEKNFKEALNLNSGYCDASYYLGQIYSIQARWKESGTVFEQAALCNRSQEASLREKIEEIEQSTLSKERKEKQIEQKKKQLVQIRLTKATSFYNGAASLYNAELFIKARAMAAKAAEHPNFKKQARDLLEQIRQRIH
jgi:tetratricopeptide (TPR) repeat protein